MSVIGVRKGYPMKHSCAWASHRRTAGWGRARGAQKVRTRIKKHRTVDTILIVTESQVCGASVIPALGDGGRRIS